MVLVNVDRVLPVTGRVLIGIDHVLTDDNLTLVDICIRVQYNHMYLPNLSGRYE